MATAEEKEGKEGNNLLGSPTFTQLENGRFKCVETGHELLSKDKDSYSRSKRCRLGLIDFALSNNKPPLNMFKQDPSSRSKLICKLTGDVVNKSEEHIWKHINGKRFLNKLEQKETGNFDEKVEEEATLAMESKEKEKENKKENKKKQKDENSAKEMISDGKNCSDKDGDSDNEEVEFWMPPVGERWDFDDGGDRWGSDEDSGDENEEENETAEGIAEENASEDLSKRTKRKSTEMGPRSSVSNKKKKKSKKNPKS